MAAAPPAGQVSQPVAPQKNEMSPVLQQLNLDSIRTRTQDLFNAISSILQSFQTIPQHKWSEVLGQFSMVNVELVNLVEDIKPILKMFVVHPKNVNAENAQILPVMLSSKLLPEMESEEASLKEHILAGVSNMSLQLQTEKLQKQLEMVRAACDHAEKVLADNRKLYGLGSRQVPALIPPLDKAQAAKIAEQEKLLRAAANVGEGLKLLQHERQQPVSLPQHLITTLPSGEGGSLTYLSAGLSKGLPSTQPMTAGTLSGTPQQQVAAAQILSRSIPSPIPVLGGTTLDGTSASPMHYANSPRSGNAIMNEASPQQQQQQQQQQQSLLQRQKVQQIQNRQQLQQQQQQLRQAATPPMSQAHLQQLHQQQQAHLQHIQAHQDRHHLQQLQLQQQALHQQLQNNSMQPGQQLQQSLGQNQLAQVNQVRPHLGQMASNPTSSLFGNTQLSSNMMANLGQSMPPQPSILQQRLHMGVTMGAGGQPQRNLPSQLLADPMYNVGLAGSQNSTNLALPLQQQLVSQQNFNNIINSSQGLNFGQQRQHPQSQ